MYYYEYIVDTQRYCNRIKRKVFEQKNVQNTVRLYTAIVSWSYCVHCCCAGRVLKRCRPYPLAKV